MFSQYSPEVWAVVWQVGVATTKDDLVITQYITSEQTGAEEN